MLITTYLIVAIILVVAVTYPKEFPDLIRDPKMMLDVIGIETRRRWLLAKLGSRLWIERKRLEFSLWRMRDIIESERLKQQQQTTHDR